jgi:hypothetical protein
MSDLEEAILCHLLTALQQALAIQPFTMINRRMLEPPRVKQRTMKG